VGRSEKDGRKAVNQKSKVSAKGAVPAGRDQPLAEKIKIAIQNSKIEKDIV
jgi:hypothetical protein